MTQLQNDLIRKLETLPDITVALWKDTDLLCVFFKGKEIAHFQNDHEIDLRLTPAIIKKKGLVPPKNTNSHLDRSKNSRWIVQSFNEKQQIEEIVELVKIAVTPQGRQS